MLGGTEFDSWPDLWSSFCTVQVELGGTALSKTLNRDRRFPLKSPDNIRLYFIFLR